MADWGSNMRLAVTLQDLDVRESIPERLVTLEAPDWEIRIGRGTGSRHEELSPALNNAWFESRVLSRQHAILRADPTTKEIHIEDIGSMHGTFVTGRRLTMNEAAPLWPEDTLTLGSDVIRGSSHFSALRFKVTWTWSDGISSLSDAKPTNASTYRNTFSADYSDEESYDDPSAQVSSDPDEEDYEPYETNNDYNSEPDDEVHVVQNSVREPSIELVVPEVRTFTVPESDGASHTGSYASGEDVSEENSPASSPLIPCDIHEDKAADDFSHLYHDAGTPPASPDPTNSIQVLVTSSAQQAELLPAMDDDASEEDLCRDDEFENEHSNSLCSLHIPPTKVDGPEQYSAARMNPLGATDHLEHVRAPSPSDAAMVKPSIEPASRVTLAAPPFPTSNPSGQQPETMDNTVAQGRPNSAWAGHNSVLYEPVAHQLVPEQSSSVYYPHYASYTPLYTNSFTFQPPTMLTPAPPPSPLSIASIAPQQRDFDESKKRRADQISVDEPLDSNTISSDYYSSDLEAVLATTATSRIGGASNIVGETTLSPTTSALEITESVSNKDTEMPAQKKAKKIHIKATEQRGSGSSSFVKTAGATIAGMAIGAVGMFIGLLAIPEDYFI